MDGEICGCDWFASVLVILKLSDQGTLFMVRRPLDVNDDREGQFLKVSSRRASTDPKWVNCCSSGFELSLVSASLEMSWLGTDRTQTRKKLIFPALTL